MQKRSKILSLIVTLFLLIISTISGVMIAEAMSLGSWSTINVKSEYDYGIIFTVPQRTFTVNDQTVDAVATVEKPDGTVTSESSVKLDQVGIYDLMYTASIGGKNYFDVSSFNVRYGLTSTGEKSSVEYGKDDNAESKEGLLVNLARNEKLVFNEVIDMTKLTKNDTLIELFATPEIPGSREFSSFTITFTDITNANNYLTLYLSDVDSLYPGESFCRAGGNGQKVISYMEEWRLINEVRAKHSFKSADKYNQPFATDKYVVDFRLDQETMNVYAIDTDRMRLVVGLTDANYQSVLWGGFESGKVRCSIELSGYSGIYANFCVSKLFGVDLTKKYATDTEGPAITVDCQEEMPVGVVGKQYPISSASAYDVCTGAADVRTEVWFNYASENAVRIPVQNGVFQTKYRGVYSIVYKAADQLGNYSEKVLKVKTVPEVEEITVELGSGYLTEAVLGQVVECPTPTMEGGSGDKLYTIKAVNENDVLTPKDNTFQFEKEGVWTIIYTVNDYIGNEVTKSYTVTVSRGAAPLFNETPIMPEIFISGSAYVLPVCYASDYTSGSLVKTLADVEITDADGTRTVKAGESFIPMVNNNGDKVTVTYKCGMATPIVFEIPTIQAWVYSEGRNRLRLANYFYGDGVTATATDDSVELEALNSGNSTVTFANTLIAQSLTLDLEAVPQNSKFDGIVVTLVDKLDSDIAVSIQVRKSGLQSKISVSGETALVSFGFIGLSATNQLSLGYKDGYVSLGSTYKVEVSKCDNGELFNGFPSNSVYLKIAFLNAQAGAKLAVVNVDGAPMTDAITDRIKPKIVAMDTYGGTYSINSNVDIKPIFLSGDVVDPNVNFTVTVKDPSGAIVNDINGKALSAVDPYQSYTICLEKYGQYIVSYSSADTFNPRPNELPFDYAINVFDEVSPVILFDAKFVSEANVGDIVVIPDFEVSDNQTPSEEILILKNVQNPNGVWICLTGDSNSIKCEHSGTYVFTIMAMDAAGNTTLVKVGVVVK